MPSLEFDVAASAGWYSSIAGLLAGFALLAVLLPLDHQTSTHDKDAEDAAGDAAASFVCAFFSLITLAAAYAILAGRVGGEAVDAIAVHEQMLIGGAFALSTLLLLFGLHAVLRDYGANRTVFGSADGVILATSSVLGPFVVLALQFSNALDVQRERLAASNPTSCETLSTAVLVNIAIVGTAVIAIALIAVFRTRLPRRPGAATLVAKVVLGVTLVAVIWSSAVAPLLPVSFLTAAAFEHIALGVSATLLVAFSAATWMGR